MYIAPRYGYDQSQSQLREITGPMLLMIKSFIGYNPFKIHENDEQSLTITREIFDFLTEPKQINYNQEFIMEKYKPRWSKSEKTAPKNLELYSKFKQLFFDGYTLQQVVKALRTAGLLA